VSEKFLPIAKHHNFRTAFYCNNKLDRFIRTGKDKLDPMCQNDVVYKIFCHDYEATYVGHHRY
jgi:hypothetical protein